jgi:hypothetical protein
MRLIAIFLVLLALLIFVDYGITWDETVELFKRHKGPRTFAFWFGGFDPSNAPFTTGHNPFTFFIYYTLHHGLEALGLATEIHETYHLLTAFIAILGFVLSYRVACSILPERWALVAAVFVMLSPRFFGHSFANFKDIPFAVAWLFCIHTLLGAVRNLTTRKILLHGAALGVLLTVRIGGLMFVPISVLGIALGAYNSERPQWLQRALGFTAAMGLALAIHYLSYPYLLLHPIDGIWELLSTQSQFAWQGETLTLGQAIHSDAVPFWYAPLWLLITLPEIIVLGVVMAILFFVFRLARPTVEGTILGVSLGLPLAYVILTAAPIYDGARHILFLFPLLTIVAFWGLHALHQRLPWSFALPGVLAVAGLSLIFTIVQLHPYQSTYFNQFVGGVDDAQGQFTVDYWASTSKESAHWLKQEHGEMGRLCVTAELSQSWELYMPNWVVEDTTSIDDCPRWCEYAYAFARNDWLDKAAAYAKAHPTLWKPVHHIERAGARLGTVFKNLQPVTRP